MRSLTHLLLFALVLPCMGAKSCLDGSTVGEDTMPPKSFPMGGCMELAADLLANCQNLVQLDEATCIGDRLDLWLSAEATMLAKPNSVTKYLEIIACEVDHGGCTPLYVQLANGSIVAGYADCPSGLPAVCTPQFNACRGN